MITTGKIYISPVLAFYMDVYFFLFIISLLVITMTSTSFYSTHISDKFNEFNKIFITGKLEWRTSTVSFSQIYSY